MVDQLMTDGKPDPLEERYEAERPGWDHEATPPLWPSHEQRVEQRDNRLAAADWLVRESAQHWYQPHVEHHKGVLDVPTDPPAIQPPGRDDVLQACRHDRLGYRWLIGVTGRPRFEASVSDLVAWVVEGAPCGTVGEVTREAIRRRKEGVA